MSLQLKERPAAHAAPVAEDLWEHLEASMLPDGALPPLRVLFATDGSPSAEVARRFISALGLPAGSTVEVVVALDAPEREFPASLRGAEREWVRCVVEQAQTALARPGVAFAHDAPRGNPAHEILR